MFVIETPGGVRIAVDTCVGNDKERELELWNKTQGPFLQHLEAGGVSRESVDFVLCTHLHVDHVGWNTILQDGRWVPTFPNAKYLFAREEFDHWSAEVEAGRGTHDTTDEAVMADSIQPILEAGLHELVEMDKVIVDEGEAAKVWLTPTTGHTPGHVSVCIASEGERALITGDCIHHPMQMASVDTRCFADSDQEAAVATRRQLLTSLAGSKCMLIGTHFAAPSRGLVRAGEGDADQGSEFVLDVCHACC